MTRTGREAPISRDPTSSLAGMTPKKLDNGPGTVSGEEPVAKALGLSSIAAAIVVVAAAFGLNLDAGEVLVVLVGAVTLANLVGTILARKSATPNGKVPPAP